MTSAARVDFYFDVVCPYAYLAHTQIEAICGRTGAELAWKPILLGGLFRVVRGDDGPMPGMPAARVTMNLRDMHRWAEHWGVPLALPAAHPRRSVLAMRAILASGDTARAAKALYRAYWVDGLDVAEPRVVAEVLDAAGLDGAALVKRSDEAAIKDQLKARTDEAARAGAFGVPAMVIHRSGREPELHWGQDRLHFVEESLRAEAVAPPPPGRPLSADAAPELAIYFDYSSPFAYLGATQVERVAKENGARVAWRPFLLGALFKSIGTPDVPLLTMSAAKQRFITGDLDRWAAHWRVPFRFPSRFPMSTVAALRMTLQVAADSVARLALPLFHALWVDDRDLANKRELAAIADSAGFDGAALVAGCDRPEVKEQLRDATARAEAAGVCGAPCFLVVTREHPEGTLFWGQDRLALVEKALRGWRPARG